MSAEVTREPGFTKWLAWCEECGDGVRQGRARAEAWADRHNAARHSIPTPHVDREQWIPGK
ncbi:hypothetical protein SEA_KLEVEY_70 [Arthrobacter phage Klevey]|uniref:Uncharacterized protein n=1 Tax=Arthrobacter phage Klevey TaxID=2867481 RepID=A0AAE8XJX8_9CAUD|nr:hypothetical protein SEA_KLEVEY_70 [Arthrobacter phage Klevey]